ncbi:hypothetical protein BDR26DRAFT_864902 [Obelidium mucronatum]|nr:hypothetical protein BDR26DRAFT_864902 [Obelidium mucronatum]
MTITTKVKGRCWCCWDTAEKDDDRLIRICRGCKDIDLQWIHQNCANQFLTKLPSPKKPWFRRTQPTFKCTRCNFPYKVRETPLFPSVWAAFASPSSDLSFRLMLPAMIMLSCAIVYLSAQLRSDDVLRESSGVFLRMGQTRLRISLSFVAWILLLYCCIAVLYGVYAIIDTVSSKVNRTVVGIQDDKSE